MSVSTTAGGVVVVTHVHAVHQPALCVGNQLFSKGKPLALGVRRSVSGDETDQHTQGLLQLSEGDVTSGWENKATDRIYNPIILFGGCWLVVMTAILSTHHTHF